MSLRVSQLVVQVLRTQADIPGLKVSAATSFGFSDLAGGHNPTVRASAVSTIVITPAPVGGGDFEVSAASGVILSGNPRAHNTSVYVSAITSIGLSFRGSNNQPIFLSAGPSNFNVADKASAFKVTGPGVVNVSAFTAFGLSDDASPSAARILRVSAITTLNLPDITTPAVKGLLRNSVSAGLRFSDRASVARVANAAATTSITLGSQAIGARDIYVGAVTSIGLSSARGGSNRFFYGASSVAFAMSDLATAIHGGLGAATSFRFGDRADAVVLLPAGGGVPGGSTGGMRTVLLPDVSGEFPYSFAETPSGLILIANGIDPMVRWDGLTGLADTAGIQAPARAIEFGGVGVGTITGRRVAYVRFVDRYGNFSNLSPVSNEVDFGTDGPIDDVTYAPATGAVTVRSAEHGRATGDAIIVEGVEGLALANGQWTITVLDADRFRLDGLTLTTGKYQQGGRWVYGIKMVGYGNVAAPTEPKVERRQILRNLDGNAEVFYVDIDTDDLASTAFLSAKSDEDLAAGVPVPLTTADETPHANRFGTPPSHKAIVASHLGRIFAAGDVSYTRGNCQPVFGQRLIKGVGTAWRKSMVGRVIYMVGAANAYEIADVDETNQDILTTQVVKDATGPFTSYAIRPPAGERRFVYFSEPALPEAWPPWNAISLPESSDEITGLMVKNSFLYVLERRHISKFTFQTDPSRDGFVFPSTNRGCVNNRCWVQIEDDCLMLDEVGIHRFDGQKSRPISAPIQNLFQQIGLGGLQVNWNADQRYWHAAHDAVRDTIRWFVAMTGGLYPRHAICYDYRRDRFWIEEYPFVMTSSTVSTIGYRRSVAGSEARRVLCLGEGALDAVDAGNGLRGEVTSAGPMSLTDSSAPFPPNLAGAPVSIASGKGVGQQRRIAANTADTLRIDRPWLTRPDGSSVYQIGGVNWTWQSGWFRFVEEESDNPRDVEMVFQPVKGDSSVNLRLFYDHADRPRAWARTIDSDGISLIDGMPEVTVDMTHRSGFVRHGDTGHREVRSHADRYVSVELSGVQAGEIHRVYQVTLNGVRQA